MAIYKEDTDWAFKNSHVPDPTMNGNEFIVSSGRCVIYAQNAITNIFSPVGLIQAYTFNEQRQVDMLFELGSELPYLVPGRTTGQIAITRMLMNGKDIANVLYGYSAGSVSDLFVNVKTIKSLKDINKPVNLMFAAFATSAASSREDWNGEKDGTVTGAKLFSRMFKNCWITSRSESIGAGQTVVGENCSLVYEDIVGISYINEPYKAATPAPTA
jgi:hypothetical protein